MFAIRERRRDGLGSACSRSGRDVETAPEPVIYTNADLNSSKFQLSVTLAKNYWKRQCDKYVSAHGDQGTCVLGAGIEIWHLAPRCRIPRDYEIISQHQVTGAQGSLRYGKHQ